MALIVTLAVNKDPIGELTIHNLAGDLNGECTYEVTHGDQSALFTHYRPDGALECVRKAIVALEASE